MNKASRALASVQVIGSTSLVSPENVFRSPRAPIPADHYRGKKFERQESRALRQLEKMTGGPRSSYQVKMGGDKLNYAACSGSHGSAIKVIPGEHVPVDFGSEFLTPINPALEQWIERGKDKSALLMWFEMTTEGKTSRESVARLQEQLKASRAQLNEAALLGDLVSEADYSKMVQAAQRNSDALKTAEQAHFDKAHMKHVLSKPKKDPNNTAKVVSSILDAMLKPGEHLPARQTPEALRKIGVDKNGNITGKPSADRIRDASGHIILAESIEVSPEDLAADKKEAAQHKVQKSGDSSVAKTDARQDKINFLSAEVARLENEKVLHGLSKERNQDLARLTAELKATKTRLTNDLKPVKDQVRGSGLKKLSGCQKHSGSTSCQCWREVLIDVGRGITKRTKKG